ncbi:hypothetical protein [Paenibacillus whitsoniae]|uniref:Uncharacterized protein n=1 Tax=Paenibacillus whitsoniae TaxID=2496558 RepID=A0A430JFE4_9BACL|nr:hypothetical protein [Paenibacillus whitsoniae]RTE09695.1 hypothetical protein EJQ19_10620 [Paenibacillus whitsoniae]
MSEGEQKRERKFHFIGVLIGLCIDNFGTLLTSGLIGSLFFADSTLSDSELQKLYDNVGLMLLLLVMGLSWTLFGSYMTARIARRAEIFNAAIIGVIGAGIGFDSMLTDQSVPLWYELLGFIAIVPVSMLGGYMALKKKRARLK